MHPYVVADVFTEQPLKGNPVAVFTAGQDVPAELMQAIARETNLSETVFVLPADQGGDAKVRIFTPAIELPFAGHPILGTAYVLGQSTDQDVITLETGKGLVPVTLTRAGGRIVSGRMTQPVPTWQVFEEAGELLAAIGVRYSVLPVEVYTNGPRHLYVMLDNVDAVAALRPDLSILAGLPEIGVNCFAGSGTEWKTRMFGPSLGVAEDPATGSAAGPLAVHLVRHRKVQFGQEITISQGAEIHRPSTLYARVEGNAERIDKVEVAGSAVIVAHGQLVL
ncbi:trans-2,3-dihydro-3-hydroxyanthranilate isomerase [Kibdelosporangium banguiense]|uniref:Trans-2,3-dihydro-3-hydroxyanthranilate isomerase n=1 Tax=Kibdelosporangium banguiense TaxID=1365924 RepID=A0ABS4T9J6_9PSEU|nr:PhzF family phenazine biosynthesis protein [Kibdelosporangium banguiense]MBP2321093.1 trans-2,3-dihydro-3-hydroxyanthranilate isomerase [Kibdelosporangium banguiense]